MLDIPALRTPVIFPPKRSAGDRTDTGGWLSVGKPFELLLDAALQLTGLLIPAGVRVRETPNETRATPAKDPPR